MKPASVNLHSQETAIFTWHSRQFGHEKAARRATENAPIARTPLTQLCRPQQRAGAGKQVRQPVQVTKPHQPTTTSEHVLLPELQW